VKRATAVFVLLCWCTPARAQSAAAQQELEQADRLYGDLDYRAAAELAEKVGKDEQATRGQRARAWEREGLSWLILGQKSLAKEAFVQLFTLDPERSVDDPSLSPRQRQFIEDVRAEQQALHPATPEPKPEPTPTPAPEPKPEPKPVDKRPVYKKWWLWTTVGLVAAAGVGLGVGLGLGLSSGPPKGSLGTVGLSLRW